MKRLTQNISWVLVGSVGSVHRSGIPSLARSLGGAEDQQKKQPYAHPPRVGFLGSPRYSSSLQKPDPERRHDQRDLLLSFQNKQNEAGGLRVLPPGDDNVFSLRLLKIWEGLMNFQMTPEWEDTISCFSSELWRSQIAEHIPMDVKSMLVSRQPPTIARLKCQGWSDTTAAGVYIYISKPNRKSVSTVPHVYVGSASDYSGGLKIRRIRMLFPSPSTQRDSLKSKTRDFDLIPEGEFITLCIVPFKGDSDDEVADVRALVILIRAVLTIWLGAIDRSLKPAVKDLVPWGLEYIRYVGLATDNPFATNFIGIERTSKRGKLESTN